jgi:hypothetical protein
MVHSNERSGRRNGVSPPMVLTMNPSLVSLVSSISLLVRWAFRLPLRFFQLRSIRRSGKHLVLVKVNTPVYDRIIEYKLNVNSIGNANLVSRKFMPNEEVINWLNHHSIAKCRNLNMPNGDVMMVFDSEDDAFAFRMRWC